MLVYNGSLALVCVLHALTLARAFLCKRGLVLALPPSQALLVDAQVSIPALDPTPRKPCAGQGPALIASRVKQSKNQLHDAPGSGNHIKNCRFASPACRQREVLEELTCQEGKSSSLHLTLLPVAPLEIPLWFQSLPFPRPS